MKIIDKKMMSPKLFDDKWLKKPSKKELYDLVEEQNKEIERLKEQLSNEIDEELKQSEIMVKKQQEIERLNNNWNKLEEWLNIQQNISSPEQILNNIFNKLQELKGEDKE